MAINIKQFASDPLAFFNSLVIPSARGTKPFAEVMGEFQRQWFTTIAPSLLAVAAGEQPPIGRFWCERTKGASKDSDVACCLLWLLAFSRQRLDCQAGASDRDQANELRKAATDIVRLNSWLSQRIESQAWTLRCRATGSEVNIIASDVAGSHGSRPDIVVMNELSHVTKEEFAANLLDNASKKPHGLVIVATNAGMLDSWQHSWRSMAQDSPRWDFHTYSQPAPWLADEELEEAQRRNSRARFNRLFHGEWISQSGDALDQQDIDACTDSTLAPMGREDGWFYIAGLDLSVSQDHSALTILGGRHDTQQLRLAYCESWAPDPKTRKVDLMKIESTILQMHERFDLLSLVYDPYQSQLMAQRLSRQGLTCEEMHFVGKNLNEMASTLLEVFRSRRIAMYHHKKLIADLQRLVIVEKSYGYKLESQRTQDGHSDTAIALAIALPKCVEEAGQPRMSIGAIDIFAPDENNYMSPFDEAMQTLESHARDYQKMDQLWRQGEDHQAEMRELMRQAGRASY